MEAIGQHRVPALGRFAAAGRRVRGLLGPHARIWSLTVVLAGVTGAVFAAGLVRERGPFGTLLAAFPAVAVLYFCAEQFTVHLVVRRETHTFSLTEIPLVIGLFFLSPLAILLAQVLGAGTALLVHRRQPPIKLAFNLANFALSTTCAIVIFNAVLGSGDALGPTGWLAAYAATFAADQLSGLGVALVIWLSQGERFELSPLIGIGTLYTFVDTSLALLAVLVLSVRPESSWMLAVLAVTTLLGFRLYQDERVKRESLGSLQESTRRIQETLQTENVTRLLLQQVRDMFNARVAELLIFPGGPLPAVATRLDVDDVITSERVTELDPDDGVAAMTASRSAGRLIVRRSADDASRRWLEDREFADAMVAPVRDGEVVRGMLVAGDRMGNAGTFRAEHLALFETLANHAAVAMKNSYLVDRLRAEAELNVYQARHDALTELPNRTLFRERLDEALGADARCAVLLLDVNRFKEVNDTLGHHNGDVLLQAMALRLVENVGPAELVARLSGDEYAVLLAQPATDHGSIEERAVAVARSIGTAFATPFGVEGLALGLTVSIGISLSPDHGSTVDALIRRADVAMYLAKRDRTGYEVYRADRDEYSAARLALIADLRTAVERDEIEVAYQMQVDAATGNVEGAEALARWRHPVRGLVQPDVFIGLAERAGFIRDLTERVLRLAVRDTVAWRRRWPGLRVSVNLSPRTLVDPTLPPLVRRVLAEHGLPPSALTLEVTESAIVGDSLRVEEALRDFDSLGCPVSIDDFGTGYSSFSYLRRLPIHELKVDRSFVHGMATDAKDRAIVELTIDLGHRLGKRVVAEGVETDQDAERLVGFGCDVLQGFLISRPVSSEAFMEAVEARRRELRLHREPGRPHRVAAGRTDARPGRRPRGQPLIVIAGVDPRI